MSKPWSFECLSLCRWLKLHRFCDLDTRTAAGRALSVVRRVRARKAAPSVMVSSATGHRCGAGGQASSGLMVVPAFNHYIHL